MDFKDADRLDQNLIESLTAVEVAERERGWRQLYKTYLPIVRELVWNNNGSDDDIHDVFQEGLAILHSNLLSGKFRKESTIGTYLYSICRNIWLRTLRNREKERLSITEMIEDLKTDENTVLLDVEVVTILLDEMHEDCRKILVEFYYNCRSAEELKTIFNVKSAQVAKNKKWRCLGQLKRMFLDRSIIPYQDK